MRHARLLVKATPFEQTISIVATRVISRLESDYIQDQQIQHYNRRAFHEG